MAEIMQNLQNNPPKSIGGYTVLAVDNYDHQRNRTDVATGAVSKLTLPKSSVLYYHCTDDVTVGIRPSGTEPKIKAYYTTVAPTRAEARAMEAGISADFAKF